MKHTLLAAIDASSTASASPEASAVGGLRQLVLIGAGHAHAQVLQSLIDHPIAGLDIVVISPISQAPYSGMMPAWLAGHHDWQACCIDFNHLCRRAGARMIAETVLSIDPDARIVTLENDRTVPYAWLSINIGSTLQAPAVDVPRGPVQVVPMRPLSALCERWQSVLDDVSQRASGSAYQVVMVGGGAAGIESMLAVHHRLRTLRASLAYRFTLATQGKTLVPGLSFIAGKMLQRHLQRRGIVVRTGFSAKQIGNGAVSDHDGRSINADLVCWATGAQAFAWPGASGLATNAGGFIRINQTLQSMSHSHVFAAGDCVAWHEPLPKAGVFAVRMGPVLAHNLRASITDAPLVSYRPQRRYLVLVGTGDRHAVASWGFLGWQGAWVYRWKQRIDQRFLATYNHA